MFIRRTDHLNRASGQRYCTYKLVESLRTDRGPRQRTLLNLGADFNIPRDRWKELADRIEAIVYGQSSFLPASEEIETIARGYARQLIAKQGLIATEAVEARGEPDYHSVDINTLESEQIRSVGAESVVLSAIRELELDKKLLELGLGRPWVDAAVGVIAGRLLVPSSERATHLWLKNNTALGDLLETDLGSLSQDRVYRVCDILLKNKAFLEAHLENRERSLFNLQDRVFLYDLTNTFFEGSGRYNEKAHFGVSKEKRTDCPLVTLGLVLNQDGFPKRSDVFEGNIGEPGTLEEIIPACGAIKPIIVADAGIGTEENVEWMKKEGFGYVVVSRRRKKEIPSNLAMVTIREDSSRLIRACSELNCQGEREIYFHSSAREMKDAGIRNRFEKGFEERLTHAREALLKKGGTKKYDKVIERIGRLKERYRRVARRYEIRVEKDDNTANALDLTWYKKDTDDTSGWYVLRTNRVDLTEQEVFDIFTMLLDVEDAFGSMKSELGLRPIHHQTERRCDSHLFITVLAYHVLHTIRTRLREKQITHRWSTIRTTLSTHQRVTTSMKRKDGKMIYIRKTGKPEQSHTRIYDALNLPHRPGRTITTIL